MLKFSHSGLIYISGLVWMAVGIFLLQLGLQLLLGPAYLIQNNEYPLVSFIKNYIGGFHESAILVTVVALYVGFLKGKHVLGKAAKKGVERICTLPSPTGIQNLYNAKYLILLGGMVCLGILIKVSGIPNDIRGAVDIAVGSALINGAMEYFRRGYEVGKQKVRVD